MDIRNSIVEVSLLVWAALEIYRGSHRWKLTDSHRADEGTSRLIFLVLAACFFISALVRVLNDGYFEIESWVGWVGVILLVSGIAFRHYAISVLGRLFSPVVQIMPGHELITSGPYCYLRHPAYTGLLIASLGAGIASANWFMLFTFIILPTLAVLRRIRVEERALEEHFGSKYTEYKAHTRSLLPYIY